MPRKPKIEPKKSPGRPRVLIADEKTIERIKLIASGQHTQAEAAAMLGVSLATFEGFLRANAEIKEAWEEGRNEGLASLRRLQFAAAQKGSVPMQIWLGKQYLSQTDKQMLDQKHEAGDTFRALWEQLSKREAAK